MAVAEDEPPSHAQPRPLSVDAAGGSEERPTTWENFLQSYWEEIQRRTAYEKEMAATLGRLTSHSEMVMQMVNGLATQNQHFQVQVTQLSTRLEKLEAQLAAVSKEGTAPAPVTPVMDGAITPPGQRGSASSSVAAAAPNVQTPVPVVDVEMDQEVYYSRSDLEDAGECEPRAKQAKLVAAEAAAEATERAPNRAENRERSPRRGKDDSAVPAGISKDL